jgi:hypothetical protein
MKRFKINVALFAMVLGVTAAFAFKPEIKASKFVDVTWSRTGTVAAPEGNSWLQTSSGTCDEALKICQATFVSGYNPNTHTYAQNQANATSVISDEGVLIQ